MPTWIPPANLHRSKGNSAYFDWPQSLASITLMSPNTQCTLTKYLKNTTRVNFKNHKYPYGAQAANPPSEQQFQAQELVSFASHLAISRTFNSLFKVLFTFPSRYLFAIGLETVFSFRRKFPPILRTTSKVRDSAWTRRTRRLSNERRDSHPLWSFIPKRITSESTLAMPLKNTIQRTGFSDFHSKLLRVHSPLLTESFSFPFLPLTYMLKFSG